MEKEQTTSFIFLALFLLSLTSFLNFISSLYSDIDISKIDLSRINRKKKRIKKILYIIKNSYFLFVGICILLIFFHISLSKIIVDEILKKILTNNSSANHWLFTELATAFFLVLFTEILVRYLVDKETTKRWVLNPFLLEFTYIFTRIASWPLKWVIKEKRVSTYKERDLIRLMANLEAENILEPQEARLLQAAFRFDEENVDKIFRSRKNVIVLFTNMNFKEIQQIYFKYRFTRYPVLNENKEIFGVLNFKTLNLNMRNKEEDWKNFVEKKATHVSLNTKLSAALEILQKNRDHLAIVSDKEKFVGIVTLEDILESLVGEIHDENERK